MAPDDAHSHSTATYGIGDSAPRPEDRRLVTGHGTYSDDVSLPDQAWGVVLRSTVAHAQIVHLHVDAARGMPGVLAVYTGADLSDAGYGGFRCKLPLKNRDESPLLAPERPILATDRVRYVGEGVAFVVAETLAQARDAAEAVELDLAPLATVVRLEDAAASGAERIHADVPANTALDWAYGDDAAVDEAFAGADHVTRIELTNNRVTASPLEPRAAVAAFDPADGAFTLRLGCQGVFAISRGLAELLGIDPKRVRVLANDVGGSFGMKGPPYPEYALLLHAARVLGRPVKWRDDRSDSFVADNHGRDSVVTAELALDAEGRFLAMRVRSVGNMGAWLTPMGPHIQSVNILKNLPGPYTTPLLRVEVRCVFTNTTPIGPYRGAGRPEGVYIRERLIDEAARETGRDPIELRRLNVIAPQDLPYTAASGLTYDSGAFEAVLDQALDLADWSGFDARRMETEEQGRLRGRGVSLYLEVTAPVGKEMGGLRFGPDGAVTIVTGTKNFGQGHHAAFAQVVADRLGVPFDRIDLVQGDSAQLLHGGGTGGSRSLMASGTALLEAADQVIAKGRMLASHLLEAAAEDVEFGAGAFRVAGTDRAISLAEIAARTLRRRAAGRCCRSRSTANWWSRLRRRPSRTAAMSARSRSIRRRGR